MHCFFFVCFFFTVSSGVSAESEGLKSEISLVHEIALKRSLTVTFEVLRESGPPHMRTFVTRCSCGEITVEGKLLLMFTLSLCIFY